MALPTNPASEGAVENLSDVFIAQITTLKSGLMTGFQASLQAQSKMLGSFNELTNLFARKAEEDSASEGIRLEKQREDRRHLESLFSDLSSSFSDSINDLKDILKPEKTNLGTFALILAGLAALLMGFVGGLVKSFKDLFNLVNKSIRGIGKLLRLDVLIDNIKRPFTGLFERVATAARNVRQFFSNQIAKIGNSLRNSSTIIDDAVKGFKTVIGNFKAGFFNVGKSLTDAIPKPTVIGDFSTFAGRLGASLRTIVNTILGPLARSEVLDDLKTIFDPVLDLFKSVGRTFAGIFGSEGTIAKLFAKVKSIFSFADEGSKFLGILGGIGRVIGRLFYPFTLIMGIFDTVKGAIAGYEEGGFLGAFEGAITGLLNSIIGAPLDLLKKGVSWVLGAFGFDKAVEVLESFSFTDLFKKIIGGVFDFVGGAIDVIVGLFSDPIGTIGSIMSSVGDISKRFFKKILQGILPVYDENASWYNIGNLISKAIPQSVYDFAGLDYKTGEVRDAMVANPTVATGAEVDVRSTTIADTGTATGGDVITSAPTVVNNVSNSQQSTTVAQLRSSRRTRRSEIRSGSTEYTGNNPTALAF